MQFTLPENEEEITKKNIGGSPVSFLRLSKCISPLVNTLQRNAKSEAKVLGH